MEVCNCVKHLRAELGGLIGVTARMAVSDNYSLSIIYTPGVAEPCREINRDETALRKYTWRGNAIALLGPEPATLPKLESLAALLKILGGIDAVPLVVATEKPDALADAIRKMAPTFGAFWLAGFESETALKAAALVGQEALAIATPEDSRLHDPAVYPGFFRAVLDLGISDIPDELIQTAADAKLASLYESALNVTRAVAEKTGALQISENEVAPEILVGRLQKFHDTDKLAPLEPVEDWLTASNAKETALRLHAGLIGTLSMQPKINPRDPARLLQVFDNGDDAAAAIKRTPELADSLTSRANTVAVVTDGTAVLGLGDIGAGAGLPVMLGKSVLFKTFGGCDAVPICINSRNSKDIIEIAELIAPSFGGINLEDISAPRCFEIEQELKRRLNIFVFHDDQHGTAVVTLAGLINAAKLGGKELSELTVTFNGAGAAGIAVTKLLLAAGVQDVILCDRAGAIYKGRHDNMNSEKEEMAEITNRDKVRGDLAAAVKGRDVFIGLSVAGCLSPEMVRSMAKNPIIFAMANPVPEILPDLAYEAGAAAVASGRSDFPNQINNCLGFPGIFRGALDVRAKSINDAMKMAAATAIAELVEPKKLSPNYFIPSAMDLRVPPAVAAAIARSAIDTGEAQVENNPEEIALRTKRFLYTGAF